MEGATTVMETLTKAVGDVFTLMGTCFTQITSQPVLVLFLAVNDSITDDSPRIIASATANATKRITGRFFTFSIY